MQKIEASLVQPHVIQKPAGSGEEHLYSGPQGLFLRPHGCAAHKEADPELCVISQSQAHIVDLLGQFSGRRDNRAPASHPAADPEAGAGSVGGRRRSCPSPSGPRR